MMNCNYKRDNNDTTQHVLECEKAKKFTISKGDWEQEITEIYRKNKKRELAVIKVQDQHKIIKKSEKRTK